MQQGAARITDADTSKEAAKLNTTFLQHQVLLTLIKEGPMTAEQVSEFTGISQQSLTPRFRPLVEKGLIMDTGERRKNRSGRSAILWRAIIKEQTMHLLEEDYE
jgi:DNA-binding MarR family transcriptional regulator